MKNFFKRHTYWTMALLAGSFLAFSACSDSDGDNGQSTGDEKISINVPNGGFKTTRCNVLTIKPTIVDNASYSMSWSIGDSVLSTEQTLDFIALNEGVYPITLEAINQQDEKSILNFNITVKRESKEYSPYITSVLDYRPAPGQFVNELPKYETGDTQKTMNKKALESIGYNVRNMITLGGYGGYVVCGFDHTIMNVPGEYDFKILGNAFYADANPNPSAPEKGGSCEPGIVMAY